MKKKGIKYWKKKAWDYFSKFIRLRDAIATTGTKEWVLCCSCGRRYPAFGVGCVQAGHLIPGRRNSVLFCEKGTNGQCYNCNVNLSGNWVEYERFMVKKYGTEIVEELKRKKNLTVKFQPYELEEKRDHYKQKYEDML